MQDRYARELARRGKAAFRLGVLVLVVTTLSYYLLGCWVGMNARYGKSLFSFSDDRWELTECFYAATITLTTVGYTDLLGTESLVVHRDEGGRHRWESATDDHRDEGFDEGTARIVADYSALTRTATGAAVLVGITFFLYVIAQVTSFFVEGDYEGLRAQRAALRRARRLRDHVIVCGVNETSRYAVRRLREADVPCVLIDQDLEHAREVRRESPDLPCLVGDATEEDVLRGAGIDGARAVLTVLDDDGMNLVVMVTARQLNPRARLVSRAVREASIGRLAALGAIPVLPGKLAGLRLTSSLVRPSAASFLDQILREGDEARGLHLEEIPLSVTGAGGLLGQFRVRERTGLVPIAVRRQAGDEIVYNPLASLALEAGDSLAVLGGAEQLDAARRLLAEAPAEAAPGSAPAKRQGTDPGQNPGPALENGDGRTEAARRGGDTRVDHFIVCGCGETGGWVVRELAVTGRRFVAIEKDEETASRIRAELPGATVLIRDPRDPETLAEAGVESARGMAVTLGSDRTNLIVVVTALQASPRLRVVVLCDDREAERIRRAGAQVIPRGKYGGGRMVAELLRPSVTGFLDRMLESDEGVRFESLRVAEGAPVAGKSLRDADLESTTGIRPIALCPPAAGNFIVNPGDDEVLLPGTALVVVGSPRTLPDLAARVGDYE